MENFCPCCPRHCPKDALSCPGGQAHFGMSESDAQPHGHSHGHPHGRPETPPSSTEEAILLNLRKCGHFLHHSAGQSADADQLFLALSPEEKDTLKQLLDKCLRCWEYTDI